MRRLPLATLLLIAAGCGGEVSDDHYADRSANAVEEAAHANRAQEAARHVVPVRIGELGASFGACAHAGTTRHLGEGERLPVRAAPFDSAEETGAVAAASRFFVCTRSHDQKWLGIVYEEGGALAASCGVSRPAASRRDYQGPCRSGWVASAFVRLVAGGEPVPEANRPSPGGA
jgi:hypothetical protein